MLARLAHVLFFHVQMPLLWYILLYVSISIGAIWFGFIYKDQGKDLKQAEEVLQQTEETLKQTKEALQTACKDLDTMDEELQELSQGYSTMALMLEDHHSLIVDLQMHSDAQDQRLDILNDRLNVQRESIASLGRQSFHLFVKRVDSDYTGPDDDEEEEPCAEPSPEWIKDVKGLDEL